MVFRRWQTSTDGKLSGIRVSVSKISMTIIIVVQTFAVKIVTHAVRINVADVSK